MACMPRAASTGASTTAARRVADLCFRAAKHVEEVMQVEPEFVRLHSEDSRRPRSLCCCRHKTGQRLVARAAAFKVRQPEFLKGWFEARRRRRRARQLELPDANHVSGGEMRRIYAPHRLAHRKENHDVWEIRWNGYFERPRVRTQCDKDLVVPLMHSFMEDRFDAAKTLVHLVEAGNYKQVAACRRISPSPIRVARYMYAIAACRPLQAVRRGDEVKDHSAVSVDQRLD
jgi:hypothetical protein